MICGCRSVRDNFDKWSTLTESVAACRMNLSCCACLDLRFFVEHMTGKRMSQHPAARASRLDLTGGFCVSLVAVPG